MTFNEYLAKINEDRLSSILEDEELNSFLNTPIKNLDPKYKNLLKDPGEVEGEKIKVNKEEEKSLLQKIIQFIYYDDFYEEEEWDEGGTFFDPYFVYRDDTNEPCGYILYEMSSPLAKEVLNIVLFSFDISKKDFGKQIWTDLKKDLKRKIEEGYDVHWRSKKSNPACNRYDVLIKEFRGTRQDEGGIWHYEIRGEI